MTEHLDLSSPAFTEAELSRTDIVALLEKATADEPADFTGKSLNGLNPDSGELYWSEPLATAFGMAIMAPRKDGDYLFAGGHNGKSVGLKLDADRPAVSKAWQGSRTTGLAPVSGTPLVEDGVAYGVVGLIGFLAQAIIGFELHLLPTVAA